MKSGQTGKWLRRVVAILLIFGSGYGLLLPGITATWYILTDPGLGADEPSRFAIRFHRLFASHYADYARDRVASGAATELTTFQIAETEWPLFGSVFFLWATEQLQADYEENPSLFRAEPRVYASEAIEAATDLVLDPGHATWVRDHWGDGYMEEGNCFYRMLVMSAITAHHRLTGSTTHVPLLREQVDLMKAELLATRTGLIEDYPSQCYPGDVVAAIVAIVRAEELLGTPDPAFAELIGLRLFRPGQPGRFGLPPYAANAETGVPFDHSRGCSNSYFTTFAPHAWPRGAQEWFQSYLDGFWQQDWFGAGFREFPRDAGNASYFDVDAGPVVWGWGASATSFGVGAARTNGHFGHAKAMATQMIAACWPMLDGEFLLTKYAFESEHAPYLGQAAMLFQLTRRPWDGCPIADDKHVPIPASTWFALSVYFLSGLPLFWIGVRILRR